MSIIGSIKKGAGAVQSAYNQQKVAAEERAKRKMAVARTRLEKERAKLELEREKIALQRELFEAKAALQREKVAIAAEKRATGQIPFTERASGFLSRSAKSYRELQDKMYGPEPKKRKTVKQKATGVKRPTKK